jgi:hypothetical protein
MVSDLADGVGRIIPFVHKVQEKTVPDDVDLLDEVIRRLFDLAMDTAEFICGYVCRSPLSMSIIVLNDSNSDVETERTMKSIISIRDRTRIEELIGDLGKLAADFDRAINVEVLGAVKTVGK